MKTQLSNKENKEGERGKRRKRKIKVIIHDRKGEEIKKQKNRTDNS